MVVLGRRRRDAVDARHRTRRLHDGSRAAGYDRRRRLVAAALLATVIHLKHNNSLLHFRQHATFSDDLTMQVDRVW